MTLSSFRVIALELRNENNKTLLGIWRRLLMKHFKMNHDVFLSYQKIFTKKIYSKQILY